MDHRHVESAWRRGRAAAVRRPVWIVVAAGIALAVLSGSTILGLHGTALSEEREVSMLADLRAQAYRMLSINEEMRVEGPTAALHDQYQGVRHEVSGILARLSDHLPPAELQGLAGAYSAFTDVLDIELGLLDRGELGTMPAVHERLDVTFALLIEDLAQRERHAQAEADATSAQSDVGTVIALAMSVAAIAGLVAQFERVRRQRALSDVHRRRERDASTFSLIENSSDLVLVIDRDERIRFASGASRRVLNVEPPELVGRSLDTLVHPDDEGSLRRAIAEVVRDGQAGPTVECRLRRGAEWQHTEMALVNLLDDQSVRGIVLNARDVTDRRALERRLAHQALHDPLTGLANRRLFLQRLERLVTDRSPAAVLFVDLDGFKALNDSLGHAGGDRLLVGLAERLRLTLRPGDTMARIGGDEFAALLEGVRDAEAAVAVAQRLVDALAPPFEVFGSEVFIAASMGIAVATDDQSAESVIGNADIAMYTAKSRGSGRVEVFEPAMRENAQARSELALELRGAVERSEFSVRYQPIVDLALGTLAGFEALVRWEHPTRGEIAPDRFIPSAEQTGLIIPIGRYVLDEACRQALTWPENVFVSVNLSTRQLQDPALVDDVRTVLRATGCAPHRLELEITETAAMDDEQLAGERLAELKALGVRLAIDDFGVGYSSLGYLRRFDVDVLKMDRSFIHGITTSSRELAFATSIVELSKLLGVQTVAEGVESAEQVRQLREIGCDLAQGYFFSRPLKIAGVRDFLRRAAEPELPESAKALHLA